eukprot:353237-Chlamydomonas_euryale.AAC.5
MVRIIAAHHSADLQPEHTCESPATRSCCKQTLLGMMPPCCSVQSGWGGGGHSPREPCMAQAWRRTHACNARDRVGHPICIDL